MRENILPSLLVFLPFLAGLLITAVSYGKEKTRNILLICATLLVFVEADILVTLRLIKGVDILQEIPGVCGLGLHFKADGFRCIYVILTAFAWFAASLFCQEYFEKKQKTERFYAFLLFTEGATMGVFLSADLFTTFLFFEIMSFTSYVWVTQEENAVAKRAAQTYLAISVLGGMSMLMGLFLLYNEFGTLLFTELNCAFTTVPPRIFAAGVCLLVGFGAKAGAFPLHVWLPKSYTEAPAPGSALLSSILSKTGIFGILVLCCTLFSRDKTFGMLIFVIGLVTMLLGALLGVFSVDLKRILACSSMSQVGFILVGAGMLSLTEERSLAVGGTILHMISHTLIKLLLFMAAGVVYRNAHALSLNAIRGYGRKKPFLKVVFLIGALAVSGIPLFSGYISKTLLHESILACEGGSFFAFAEGVFLFTGGLTLAYMLKIYVAVFVEKNRDEKLQAKYDYAKYINLGSRLSLFICALALFIWGIFPHRIMDGVVSFGQRFLGQTLSGESINYFTLENLRGAGISFVIGIIIYFGCIRTVLLSEKEGYVCPLPKWLDLEEFLYRPLLLGLLPLIFGVICRFFDSFADNLVLLLRKTLLRDAPIRGERTEGSFLSEAIGKCLNFVQSVGNHLWNRKHQKQKDYVHIMAMQHEDIKENTLIIQRSLSFGLFLVCLGLMLTLIYIILL